MLERGWHLNNTNPLRETARDRLQRAKQIGAAAQQLLHGTNQPNVVANVFLEMNGFFVALWVGEKRHSIKTKTRA